VGWAEGGGEVGSCRTLGTGGGLGQVKVLPKGGPEVEHQLLAYGMRPDGEWDGNKGLAGRYFGEASPR
jgi:hypothetical protein